MWLIKQNSKNSQKKVALVFRPVFLHQIWNFSESPEVKQENIKKECFKTLKNIYMNLIET